MRVHCTLVDTFVAVVVVTVFIFYYTVVTVAVVMIDVIATASITDAIVNVAVIMMEIVIIVVVISFIAKTGIFTAIAFVGSSRRSLWWEFNTALVLVQVLADRMARLFFFVGR